jgi:hypothetical protein
MTPMLMFTSIGMNLPISYDDVNNQSSGGILPNANPLKQRDAWHRLVTFLHIKDNA